MNRQSKKRKGINYSKLRCPYCGSSVIYRSADGIYRDNPKHTMLYVCSRYPACDSYVRVHAGHNLAPELLVLQPDPVSHLVLRSDRSTNECRPRKLETVHRWER